MLRIATSQNEACHYPFRLIDISAALNMVKQMEDVEMQNIRDLLLNPLYCVQVLLVPPFHDGLAPHQSLPGRSTTRRAGIHLATHDPLPGLYRLLHLRLLLARGVCDLHVSPISASFSVSFAPV